MRGNWRPSRNVTYWPQLLWPSAFLSRSPRLLNRGPGAHPLWVLVFSTASYFLLVWSPSAQSGAWGPLCWVLAFSTTPYLLLVWYPNWLTSCLHQVIKSFNVHPLLVGVTILHSFNPSTVKVIILIFLNRMHLLFTLVHFLFWQRGRVVGQYTTTVQRVSHNPQIPLSNRKEDSDRNSCGLIGKWIISIR